VRWLGAVTEAASHAMPSGVSRAGMPLQVHENKEQIMNLWDSEARLSRARFELKLAQSRRRATRQMKRLLRAV
jgi:hypothetical protein